MKLILGYLLDQVMILLERLWVYLAPKWWRLWEGCLQRFLRELTIAVIASVIANLLTK